MHLMYVTEQPMSAYPEAAGRDFGATALMFSNRHFDPVAGSRLYNEYLEHYRLAEEVGFDGIMLNEHHNAPFCMQAKCNVFASILAAMTKRVKIVLLGNPLPLTGLDANFYGYRNTLTLAPGQTKSLLRYVEALPNAKLEIVKACGHCVDMEQPEALAKLVKNFIGRE